MDKNNHQLDEINVQYHYLRKLAVKEKLKNRSCAFYQACEFNEFSVSSNYLNKYLFRNKYLEELSKIFYQENF